MTIGVRGSMLEECLSVLCPIPISIPSTYVCMYVCMIEEKDKKIRKG